MQDRHVWIGASVGALLILLLIGIAGSWAHFVSVFLGLEDTFGIVGNVVLITIALAVPTCVLLGIAVLGIKGYWMLFARIQPSSEGNYEALVDVRGRVITVEAGNGPVPHSYNYRYEVHPARALPGADERTVLALPAPHDLALPGPCDFADLLENWHPTRAEILLGLGPGGKPLLVPLKSLCHVALAGATGGGKSVLMRLMLAQILATGCSVALADPHFAPIDPESGEDWRPIASRLSIEPAVDYQAIRDVLFWLAETELPARLAKRRAGEAVGEPFFLAMDELPAIVATIKEAPDAMATLLREGRKVGLFLVSAAQDWLVKTVGGTGGVRDCFRTAFYVGGDTTTARVLLDVQGTVDDGSLGKGIVMLRSQATPKATLTRVPYVSNEALIEVLTAYPMPTSEPLHVSPSAATTPLQTVHLNSLAEAGRETSKVALDARSLRVREMVKSRISQRQMIQELYGVSGGAKYMEAAKELADILSKLV